MLPPGHLAAGYLVATAYESIFHPVLTPGQNKGLLWIGALAGFIPDIDMFFAFIKIKAWRIDSEKADHRAFFTHYPIIWLIMSLAIFIIGKTLSNVFIQSISIVIFLGTLSHFILDSLDSGNGIKWLWPFSNKLYTIKNNNLVVGGNSFIAYWLGLVTLYFKKAKVTAIAETTLVIVALLLLFR